MSKKKEAANCAHVCVSPSSWRGRRLGGRRFVKPTSKLPMLTQGLRADAAAAMNNPTPDMFATAQNMCLDTLFAAVGENNLAARSSRLSVLSLQTQKSKKK